MKIRGFLLFLTIGIHGLNYAQWAWQNPLPQGHQMTAIKALDSLHCWASGLNGTILTTHNGGKSWHIFNDSAKRWITSVDFTDTLHGWAVGRYGVLSHSSDGGITWINQPTDSLSWYSDVSFVDAQHGWISNLNGTPNNGGPIMKTTDGGISWTPCPVSPNAYPQIMKFIDLNHGWYSEIGQDLYATADGGNTWVKKTVGNSPIGEIYDFHFSDPMHGCAVRPYENLLYTSDGGNHWTQRTSLEIMGMGVVMDGPNVIYVSGLTYNNYANPPYQVKVAKSTDAGISWSYYELDEPAFNMYITIATPFYYDAPSLWMTGAGGAVFRSLDENQSWQPVTKNVTLAPVTDIYFDKTFPVGWVTTQYGYLLKSSDGGQNWHRLPLALSQPLTAVWFLDTLTGFVAGEKGLFVKTTDGGNSWAQAIPVYQTYNYTGIQFTDPLNGWAISHTGAVLHTEDGGLTWKQAGSTGGEEIYAFTFSDYKHGWAVGNWGTISATSDGGKHWSAEISNCQITQIWDVSFTDSLYGWCAVGRGYRLQTSDGGKNWIRSGILSGSDDSYAVKFFDHNTGYMTGEHGWPYQGFIQKTTDGGVTWTEEQIPIANTIRKIFANDSSSIYGTGWDGTIVKYTGDVIQSIPDVQPASQLQCHPNPFSGTTGISIHLTEPMPVMVEIFDQRGQHVMIITRKWCSAGEQAIPVNLKGMPAGMYYFRIHTGSITYSGSMVKL